MNAVIRARIDETLKNEAAAVLAQFGLTISDVMRITLARVATEKALPFEMRVNAATARTLEDADKGNDLHEAASADDLFRKLGI
ncbi:type II toxin-antitoxin system RelB/DinJ family antitoxin [Salmonella enterica]|nr:type II toxin-antitoxin system RelB/DinJ family antitoxin [Salmonella enterica]